MSTSKRKHVMRGPVGERRALVVEATLYDGWVRVPGSTDEWCSDEVKSAHGDVVCRICGYHECGCGEEPRACTKCGAVEDLTTYGVCWDDGCERRVAAKRKAEPSAELPDGWILHHYDGVERYQHTSDATVCQVVVGNSAQWSWHTSKYSCTKYEPTRAEAMAAALAMLQQERVAEETRQALCRTVCATEPPTCVCGNMLGTGLACFACVQERARVAAQCGAA